MSPICISIIDGNSLTLSTCRREIFNIVKLENIKKRYCTYSMYQKHFNGSCNKLRLASVVSEIITRRFEVINF